MTDEARGPGMVLSKESIAASLYKADQEFFAHQAEGNPLFCATRLSKNPASRFATDSG
jgi:hypothetical protein